MKIKPLVITLIFLVILFAIGFFGINILMKIVVGHGNEVKVPKIVGLKYDVARKKCKKIDLFVQRIEYKNHDDIEKNRIISQDPHSGIRTKKNRTIKVVVSKGPEMVKVPYLENITESNAKLRLQNAGLKLGEKKYRCDNELKKGVIINSIPRADELVSKGSEIDIIVSLGTVPSSSDKEELWKEMLDNAD